MFSCGTKVRIYTTVQPSASLRGPGFAQDEHEFLNTPSRVALLESTNLHGFQLNYQRLIYDFIRLQKPYFFLTFKACSLKVNVELVSEI